MRATASISALTKFSVMGSPRRGVASEDRLKGGADRSPDAGAGVAMLAPADAPGAVKGDVAGGADCGDANGRAVGKADGAGKGTGSGAMAGTGPGWIGCMIPGCAQAWETNWAFAHVPIT